MVGEAVVESTLGRDLGLRVRELRLAREMSQVALASVVGVDQAAVSRIENHREESLKLVTLEQVAWALDVDLVVELRERAG